MSEDVCIFCDSEFGFNECKTEVRQAVKPKGRPYRWVAIGLCCDNCSDIENVNIEYSEGLKNDTRASGQAGNGLF